MSGDDDLKSLYEICQIVPEGIWTDNIYEEIIEHVVSYTGSARGKNFTYKSQSVVISDIDKNGNSNELPA